MSLRTKLIVIFSLISIIPVAMVGTISYYLAKNALKRATIFSLNSVAEFKVGEIYLYLENYKNTTRDFSSDGFIRDSLETIEKQPNQKYRAEASLNDHLLRNKLPLNSELISIDVLNLNGRVVASSQPERMGLDLSKSIHFQKGRERIYLADIHKSDTGESILNVAAPLKARRFEKTIGVIVNNFHTRSFLDLVRGTHALQHKMASNSRGIGETGETILVNQSRLMITDSIFLENAEFRQLVDTYPIKLGFENNMETSGIWLDYRDVPVVGASMLISIDDFRWVLVTKQNADEAFMDIEKMKRFHFMFALIAFTCVVIVAFVIAKTASDPLRKLAQSLDAIGSGRMDVNIEESHRRDEIGFLESAFGKMVRSLQKNSKILEEKNKQLHELSIRDGLTEIFNHRYLMELLFREFNNAVRYGSSLSCLMIDIDNFKQINDSFGHLFGDYVLRETARIIVNYSRRTDIVGRYGGEEFTVVLPHTDSSSAKSVAEKICREISGHKYKKNGRFVSVTVSIGVAEYCSEIDSVGDLLSLADRKLYSAKKSGKNRVV